MSVSKKNFYDPRVQSGIRDDLDIPPDRLPLPGGGLPLPGGGLPLPGGGLPTYKPPSKFSIEAIVCPHSSANTNEKATKRISDTGTSSMSALRPSIVPGMPVTTPKRALPQDLPQEPSSREFRQPVTTGVAPPANNYPSSYPVLKSYPIPPYQPQQTVAPTSQTCFDTTPSTQDQSPALWSQSNVSLVTTQAPFDLPFDFRPPTTTKLQPTTNDQQPESLLDMGDERLAKRRRTGEKIDLTTSNSSGQPTELPIWHESKLVTDEDPTPYLEFLGLVDDEGKEFVQRIFRGDGYFGGEIKRIDFLAGLFTHLSTALKKRQAGITQLSDSQLGKLIVSSFLMAHRITKYLDYHGHKELFRNVVELVVKFINNNHCIATYITRGIHLDEKARYLLFGGICKSRLILWCAEKGISLNEEELNYLSREKFILKTSLGSYLLKELRQRVKDQTKVF